MTSKILAKDTKEMKYLLYLSFLRLVALMYYREALVSRIIMILLLQLYSDLFYIRIVQYILIVETIIATITILLKSSQVFTIELRKLLHIIAENKFALPQHATQHATQHTTQLFTQITNLFPMIQTSRGEEEQEQIVLLSEPLPLETKPTKIKKVQNGIWEIDGETFQEDKLRSLYRAYKSRCQLDKTNTPNNRAKFEYFAAIIQAIDNDKQETKTKIDEQFSNSLNLS